MPKKFTLFALIASSLYLFYIAAIADVTIRHDAISYQQLGTMLYQGQWLEYFTTGPNREPMYPLFVATAMHAADIAHIPFTSMLMIMQVLLLLATQLLMVAIMKHLKISDAISGLIVLYSAFSPTLNNFTFIPWSELLSMPLILWAVLLLRRAWEEPRWWLGLLLALNFIALTLTKGIFELAFAFCFLPFVIRAFLLWKNKNPAMLGRCVLVLVLWALPFTVAINGYKSLNKIYNGRFTITDRGAWALYGGTAKRMGPLTSQDFIAFLATVPHKELCYALLDKDKCFYWGEDVASDSLGREKIGELISKKFTGQNLDKELIRQALTKILQNPAQAVFMEFVESFKIFFWEAFTKPAYVIYPLWVEHLYNYNPLYYTLRYGVGILSILAFATALILIVRRKQIPVALGMTVLMVLAYLIPCSLFMIVSRYTVPLGPLHLILIAFLFQSIHLKFLDRKE